MIAFHTIQRRTYLGNVSRSKYWMSSHKEVNVIRHYFLID